MAFSMRMSMKEAMRMCAWRRSRAGWIMTIFNNITKFPRNPHTLSSGKWFCHFGKIKWKREKNSVRWEVKRDNINFFNCLRSEKRKNIFFIFFGKWKETTDDQQFPIVTKYASQTPTSTFIWMIFVIKIRFSYFCRIFFYLNPSMLGNLYSQFLLGNKN